MCEDWQKQALKEVRSDALAEHPLVKEGVELHEFVSKSAGRNRRRKRFREVVLVTWRGKTFAIGKRLTKKIEFLLKDVFPESNAKNMQLDWLAAFLQELRRVTSGRKK